MLLKQRLGTRRSKVNEAERSFASAPEHRVPKEQHGFPEYSPVHDGARHGSLSNWEERSSKSQRLCEQWETGRKNQREKYITNHP